MTKRLLALALAAMLAVAAGCSKPQSTRKPGPNRGSGRTERGAPVDGGTLNLSMFSAPKGVFNPILAEDQYDANIIGMIFNGLLRLDRKLEYTCDLCQSFDISPDNRTVTFKLRRDVKWHDGKPFTARDVAFTFRTMLHPDYPGIRTGDYAALAGVEKMLNARDALTRQVNAKQIAAENAAATKRADWDRWLSGDGMRAIRLIDDHTIAFSTDQPYAPLLQSLSTAIIPAHLFEGSDLSQLAYHPANRAPIGTGPYRLVKYVTDQYVELSRFEAYHLGKPHIETIIYKIANQDVAIGQLKSGELDAVNLKPADVELLLGDAHVTIFTRPDFGYQYMGFNVDHALFADKQVRQAVMHAINRQAIVDQLLKGYGTTINSHMPPSLWAYDEKVLNPYPYDRAKAQELLAGAGWTERNREGYLVKDGQMARFTLKYPSGNRVREASAALIQADLKAVGIKVDLQMVEFTTLATAVFDERATDAWLMGWTLSTDPDPGSIFLPNNKWGRATGWTNPRSEELIRRGTRVLKATERKPIYSEWARILNDELPFAFLYSQDVIDAVRTDRVQGLKPDVRGTFWNIWELWIPEAKQ